MSRISVCFERLASEKRKALIPYLVAGDPIKSTTVQVMHSMVENGADIIELAMPFTDPEAEGPVIQLGHERALLHNTSLVDVFAMVDEFRMTDKDTPVLLMGYLNPIERMGYEMFAISAAKAGVDAALVVNLPPEEGELLDESLRANHLDSIYLLAPTTTDKRARFICSRGRGFTYYVSLKGTTGASTINMEEVEERFRHLSQFCKIPMVVGFGIKDGPSAARVATFADGSVVGTAVVSIFESFKDSPEQIPSEVGALMHEMRQAMDTIITS